MPAKQKSAAPKKTKKEKSFEETLWDTVNLGEVPADIFFKDQHSDLKADYIMANPPFNLKDWRGPDTAMRGSEKPKPAGTPKLLTQPV